jgi:hypothetical protein
MTAHAIVIECIFIDVQSKAWARWHLDLPVSDYEEVTSVRHLREVAPAFVRQ